MEMSLVDKKYPKDKLYPTIATLDLIVYLVRDYFKIESNGE